MKLRRHSPYERSVKSNLSDELVNVYIMRPAAGLLVRALAVTAITPNHVTLAAIAAGILAALLYLPGTAVTTATAGLCLTIKDLLDSADGQLARIKEVESRTGRFLDSIGDFLVNLLVFIALGIALANATDEPAMFLFALGGFLGTTLRVSYHVFYQASYLHLQELYAQNRTTEDILPQDLLATPVTLRLQRVFQILYGWQDRLMARLDRWCARHEVASPPPRAWYEDRVGLRLSGLLGLGTELGLLTLCSLANRLELYLLLNLLLMNGVWMAAVVYRRWFLRDIAPPPPSS